MSSKWDDLAFVLSDIRWNEKEVVRYFLRTLQDSVPSGLIMPVPRCEACAYWRSPDGKKGTCDAGLFAVLRTDGDFGCVQWEEKS